jgi:hypothetical protein
MDAAHSSETPVSTYQTTRCHIPEKTATFTVTAVSTRDLMHTFTEVSNVDEI